MEHIRMVDLGFNILYQIILIPIPLVVGLLISTLKRFLHLNKYKKMLKLKNDIESISCFTANTGEYDTSECVALGYVFEYMSVGLIANCFKKIYKRIDFSAGMSDLNYNNIRKKYLKRDLLLIGGPFHNQITKELLFNPEAKNPFGFNEDATLTYTSDTGEKEMYIPELSKGDSKYFEKDYALILNVRNPLDINKRIIALIGCRSVGCYGAALFLCNKLNTIKEKIIDDEYAIVIECDGEEENITSEPIFKAYYKLNFTMT